MLGGSEAKPKQSKAPKEGVSCGFARAIAPVGIWTKSLWCLIVIELIVVFL